MTSISEMSKSMTAGRCHPCSSKHQKVVYVWKATKSRRLYDAHCPKCDTLLSQTTLANMKNPAIIKKDPVFHGIVIDFDQMEVVWK